MTAFEDFVNLELPRRSALLTEAITGYDGDPNLGAAPAIIQGAPLGTWFYEETLSKWWRKTSSTPGSWVDTSVGGGSGAGAGEVIRSYTAGVAVGDAVYQKGDGTCDQADASAVATSETLLGFVRLLDSPSPGQATIVFHGDMGGFSGLVTGAVYILSTNPGKIVRIGDTGNPYFPSAPGSVMREIGHAANATTLFVEASRDFEEN